ncbi:MAG: aminomethyl transferase family protein [Rhizobiaceae bacterium]|nr:aminomethyl transferase family protein [Rhizobiaceae bacterium]
MTCAKERSVQELIDSIPDLVNYFYNDTLGPHARDRAALTPVPPQFTNWLDEQRAWRETAVLFDQSHHMPELFLKGPDAFRLLNYLGINSFEGFVPGRAKQYLACNHNGQVIGECVLQYLDKESFELISGSHLQNWVQFHAETGGYDVTFVKDYQTSQNPHGRTNFRFGMDGPHAEKIFQEVVEGPAPEIPFFRFAKVRIAGVDMLALRHGMAGHKGVELSGPYAGGPKVRAAIVEAGRKYGLRQGGARAYFSTNGEAGWWPYPLPAVYTDERLRAFREWLPAATSWESASQLGGSFRSPNIEDYYVTPWDLGVERVLKFDHDFIGRAALERRAREPHRTKVTLVWNKEDVARIQASILEPGLPFKQLELPVSAYAFQQCDEVRSTSGELVGMSSFCGYTANEAEFLSLAAVWPSHAEPGTDVVLTWGEPDGGSRKPHVERHRQTQIRAKIAPSPYSQAVRTMKRAGFQHAG